tara:strand:- start:795 stop:1139 length:345 start_codon:yes stop_codon:yes gene_type:complete
MQSDPNRLYSSSDRDAAIRGANYARSPSNPAAQRPPATQRPVQDLRPYTGFDQIQQQIAGYGQPPRYTDYGVGSASAPWAVGPIAQAPRGRTIETSGPANYGQSPSNPNWTPGG